MKTTTALAAALFSLAIAPAASLAGSSVPPPPNSIRVEHEEIIQGLTQLEAQGAETGAAAKVVLAVMKPHLQREEELVLPLLSILPEVAEGAVTSDMAWAMDVAGRLEGQRKELFEEHARIMDALGQLISVTRDTKRQDAIGFASRVASHAMTEIEILEPSAVLVGETVRQKLAKTD